MSRSALFQPNRVPRRSTAVIPSREVGWSGAPRAPGRHEALRATRRQLLADGALRRTIACTIHHPLTGAARINVISR